MAINNPNEDSSHLKKVVGKIVLQINSDLLDLTKEYKNVKEETPLSAKGVQLEKEVENKKDDLVKILNNLNEDPKYSRDKNLNKTLKMIKMNIDTASNVLESNGPLENNEKLENIQEHIEESRKEAMDIIKEVEDEEKKAEDDIKALLTTKSMGKVEDGKQNEEAEEKEQKDKIENELASLDEHQAQRVSKMKKEIEAKMKFHKTELIEKWKAQKDVLDYQALKEFRTDMESTHRSLRHMVNEWDRRRLSDILSDHLMDVIDKYFDEYMVEFRRMDEEKRMEAACIRKRNLEIEEYRKEKRRNIPTWPKTMMYTKFKPDLLSWDQEHHLTSGSVKFGLLAEMLKNQERVMTYEQIQTRLGKNRNDQDIIKQVVSLLDTINEETIYNKIGTAWEEILLMQKKKGESLNDFFSRFETSLYSLNLAEDNFKDPGPIKKGMNSAYYIEREDMMERRMELNDKLKAVHLLRALGVEDSIKRDILSKVDFGKRPKEVFEELKTAVRDICGDGVSMKSETEVMLTRPWQEERSKSQYEDRRARRYSKSRSGSYDRSRTQKSGSYERRGGRSWDQKHSRRDYSGSRDRDSSRERSHSRGRDRSRQVVFNHRGRPNGRDLTPGPGRATYIECNPIYDRIYEADNFFRNKNKKGQVIIVDSGCPRSLMGDQEFKLLRDRFRIKKKKMRETEKFKFGPSRIYKSDFKAGLNLRIGMESINVEFYIIDGNVPILLGNDVLEPLDANIKIGKRELEFGKLNNHISLLKTPGGHYVVPVDALLGEDDQEHEQNVGGAEAEEVIKTLFLKLESNDQIKKLHEEVGHKVFTSLALENDEEKEIMKVHRYFGHRSGRKVWDLFAKAGRMSGKKEAVLNIIEKCQTCLKFRKSPPKPKVGMPVSNDFNQIVAMDLKVLDKGRGYILWIVDTFSKLIKGKYIKDKRPATIIEGIISIWIIGDGSGPGHPTVSFYSDNGGEFLNEEFINFAASLDVEIRMTAAEAPWQNGIVERHHASADIIIEKQLDENPSMDVQEAINIAAFSRNSECNKTGFSALQLTSGQNPHFPGLGEANIASSNMNSSSKYMRVLKSIDEARVQFRKIDCDNKLKKVLGQRMNPNVEKDYGMGDAVFFFDDKRKEWKKGTALVKLGKTVYLRYGNFLRRVAIDKVRPDPNGDVNKQERDLEPVEIDEEAKRFLDEETPVIEMAQEMDLAIKCSQLESKVQEMERIMKAINEEKEKPTNSEELIDTDPMDEVNDALSKGDDYVLKENDEEGKKSVKEKRMLKKQKQKEKKRMNTIQLPRIGDVIVFKEKENNVEKKAKVVNGFKKTSIYKNYRQLKLEDGELIERDFADGIKEWTTVPEEENDHGETFYMQELLNSEEYDVYPVKLVPKEDHIKPEIQEAMQAEIKKFRDFEAIEEVKDDGQFRIPIRWVVSEQKEDGKGQPYKARLCMRGDREKGKESIRSDSPTVAKESIKIALTVAANEGFEVKSGDIKSAYLQGIEIDREVFVEPPKEAGLKEKLWKLKKGAYGIIDGGRLFYLKLAEKLHDLGLHEVHSDGAVFTYVVEGKLQGLIISNVDDLLMIGNELFNNEVVEKLKDVFKFSKVETKSFIYCGCRITINEDGSIDLDQYEYIEEIKPMNKVEGDDDRELNDKEKKEARGKVGALLWVSLVTRPDVSFDVNILSSQVAKGTVKTVKEINRIISIVKSRQNKLRFIRLGDISDLKVKVFADASFANVDEATRSTSGRVILVENGDGQVNVVGWKSKKINRVCRSAKAAETRALDDALDEGVHIARILKEIYQGKIDLKAPAQINVEAVTDNKSLWESIHNTRQCEERMLRSTIASIKELLTMKMIEKIQWVPTHKQLADGLTKKGRRSDWLMTVLESNTLKSE